MVQSVIVDGVGTLQFPDDMNQPEMAAAIEKNFPLHKPDSHKAEFKAPGGLLENVVGGLTEPIISQATGLVGKVAGDVGGLAAIPANYFGLTNADPSDVKNKIQEAITVQPQTAMGKSKFNPLNAIPQAMGYINEHTLQPIAGAIGEAAGGQYGRLGAEEAERQGLGFLGVKGIPKVAKSAGEAFEGGMSKAKEVINAPGVSADELRQNIKAESDAAMKKNHQLEKEALERKTATENSATSEAETLGKVHGVSTEQLNKAVGARKIAQMQHEQHATSLAKEHVSDEAAGSSFQKSGLAKQDSLAKQRQIKAIDQEKTPAYDDARTRAKNGDTLDTNPNSQVFIEQAKAQLKQAMEDLPEGFGTDIQKKLNALSGGELKELSYEEKLKNEMDRLQGKQPKQPAKESDGLTLQQGEFFRRLGHDARFREAEGFGALNAQIMKSFGDSMREAIIAYDKRMGNYIDNYRTISQEMEGSLGGRKGEGAIEVAAGKEAETIFEKNPVEVAKQYLDGTKDSAEKLVRLVGGDKAKLSETVRGNLRAKIEHMNPAQAEKFLADNKGLLEVFPEARAPMEKLVRSKSEIDKYHEIEKAERDRVKKSADEAKKAKEKIEASGKKEAGEAEKFKSEAFKYQRDVEDISSITDKSKIATKARGIVKELRDKQEISIEKFNELNEQIDKTESLYKNSSRYKALVKGVVYASGAYKLYHIAGSL